MEIPNRQAEIDALTRKYLTDPEPESNGHRRSHAGSEATPEFSDDAVIGLCRKAKNAAKFSNLYDAGDTSAYDGDDSRADQALASILAFYTQDDLQLERLFDGSALGQRPKWKNRSEYRRRTIQKALDNLRETYTPPRSRKAQEKALEPAGEEQPKATNPLLAGRVDMQQVIEHGIEPPEELEPGIILKGAIHHIFGPSESGKTMVVLGRIKRRLEAGERVVVFDAENGPRTIGERLQRMGLDPKLAVNLYYLPFPDLTVSAESRRAFEELLDEIEPSLIVFDSWASFLSAAGFSENENAEIEHWDNALTKQAKRRGIASLIIDHVPHDGIRSRGGARKKEVADVQWRVKRTMPFNRDTVGEVVLIKEKDREGWLPGSVTFSVGGQAGKIICKPSAGTVEEHDAADGLKPTERDALATLRDKFGSDGAQAAAWFREFHNRHGKSESSFYRALRGLKSKGLVTVVDDSYFPADSPKGSPDDDSSESPINKGNTANCHELSPNCHGSNDSAAEPSTLTTVPPFIGGQSESSDDSSQGEPLVEDGTSAKIAELISRGYSEYAARAEVLAKDHTLDCECEVCQ